MAELVAEGYLDAALRLGVEEEIGRIVRESIRYSSSPRQRDGGGRLLAEAMSRLNIRFLSNRSSPISHTTKANESEEEQEEGEEEKSEGKGQAFKVNNETPIGLFVAEAASRSRRSTEKAQEWASKLMDQDIVKVGDLRQLKDEDWKSLGLTVFEVRALKNLLGEVGDGEVASEESLLMMPMEEEEEEGEGEDLIFGKLVGHRVNNNKGKGD